MLSKGRVLVVDDEPMVLKVVGRALEREGFEPVLASTGEEALRRMETESFDAVVTDHNMPGLKGSQLLVTVRTRFPHMRRILLTGWSEDDLVKRALREDPALRCLDKPVDFAVLFGLLTENPKEARDPSDGKVG
ncbi:MAG TPA: response regulator [Planctomycetota bacterium]|nr:response regulator [Planctomycetota bacterium]